MNQLADMANNLNTKMDFEYLPAAPTIRFSNTGQRGDAKYFDISLISLKKTLVDIGKNFEAFEGNEEYVESKWRNLFPKYLTDPAIKTLSTVQTLPLFTVINKILYLTNNTGEAYSEKIMPLTKDNLRSAIKFLKAQIPSEQSENRISSLLQIGENIIFYGAPGTGKSYAIDQRTNDLNAIRTVFHPDTQYSDFVGCLKPSMNGNDIRYSFKAGPFTEAIIRAWNDRENHFFLVIEELNRAPAAAVFGDIFQLLDRNERGESTYSFNVADPDLLVYLKEYVNDFPENGKLKIPANLSIYATMNSSDQAVMPLDTAFKRRWQFEYKKLDFSNSATGSLELNIGGILAHVEWKDFAQAINAILSENSIPEDRHLGPWFISNSELAEPEKMRKTLTGKLFMYLWDDVLRHGRNNLIFNNDIRTYGALVTAYEKGESILSENLTELLKPLSEADTPIE